MTHAKLRCAAPPSNFAIPRAWECSLEKGHAGDHAYHWGHDLDAAVAYRWRRTAAPGAGVTPSRPASAPAVASLSLAAAPRRETPAADDYDLLPDATDHDVRRLPTIEEMDRRDHERLGHGARLRA